MIQIFSKEIMIRRNAVPSNYLLLLGLGFALYYNFLPLGNGAARRKGFPRSIVLKQQS